jgi:hypothetical protein
MWACRTRWVPAWRRRVLTVPVAAVALVALPSLALWHYRAAPPVADDHFFLSSAADASAWNALWAPWPHPVGVAPAYRPVALLSYSLNRFLTGPSAEGFRLVNYALHGINAALVMALGLQFGDRRAAYIAGLLFAIAPTSHEAVIWISGRPVMLATTFSLSYLLCALLPVGVSRWVRCGATVVLLGAAVLTYELAVAAPLLLILLAVARPRRQAERAADSGTIVLASLAVGVGFLAARWALVGPGRDIAFLTSPNGPETPRRVVVNYAVLVLRFLGWNPFQPGMDMAASARAAALLVVIGCGGRFLARPAIGVLSRVAGAALVSYVPVAAYVAYTDRFAYPAAAFLSLAVALLLSALLSRRAVAGWAVTAALLVASGVDLVDRAREWDEAGQISAAALDTVLHDCRRPKPGSVLLFEGLPSRHRSAYLFITYFELALRNRYGRNDFGILGADDACTQADVQVPGPAAAAWRWDPIERRPRACTSLSACETGLARDATEKR